MMPKPSVFVASSKEGLKIAQAVEFNLKDEADVTVWNRNASELSKTMLESLDAAKYDFAVIILSPDDTVFSRQSSFVSARDNVLIELGLFIGKLGRERTFLVCDEDMDIKIPSDLYGVTRATYHGKRPDRNMIAAVGPACTQIKQCLCSIHNRGNLPESLSFDNLIKEYKETMDLLETENSVVLKQIIDKGDFERLIDGLYSGLLFTSRALATGYIDPLIYGDMMEYDQKTETLKIKYFAGPYNEEAICRGFPIEGMNKGVAGEAFSEQKVLIKNSTDSVPKVKGEERLKSLISIPIEKIEDSSHNIVVLNIDAAVEKAFPFEATSDYPFINERIQEIITLIRRINNLAKSITTKSKYIIAT